MLIRVQLYHPDLVIINISQNLNNSYLEPIVSTRKSVIIPYRGSFFLLRLLFYFLRSIAEIIRQEPQL